MATWTCTEKLEGGGVSRVFKFLGVFTFKVKRNNTSFCNSLGRKHGMFTFPIAKVALYTPLALWLQSLSSSDSQATIQRIESCCAGWGP